MYLIIAHDGLVGSVTEEKNNNITEIAVTDGVMEQVCTELSQALIKPHILKPWVIISAGSFNISYDKLGDLIPLYCYGELDADEVIEKIIDELLTPLNDVWKIIKEKEGKLAICSLIPNHRIQMESPYKHILTEAYDTANAEIKIINERISGCHYWIDKNLFHRNSNRLVKGYYDEDNLHLNSKGKKKVKQSINTIIKRFTS